METILSIREKISKREISAKELAQTYLKKIEEQDKDIHAFLATAPEIALKEAEEIDRKIFQKEQLPPLAGVPYSLKDAICAKGVRCTAGSRMLEQYTAAFDATVTQRLRQAGALLMGKTNMDEFGMGASTENSAFGPTKNPFDLSRVPGGSSGGSAASVAAGECVFSLGEDTGGSIRLPAAFCGVVGLKPTYGAVSRYGVIALASSLDQVGPFANTVEDAEIIFATIAGRDPFDATTVDFEYMAEGGIDCHNLRIGIPKEYFAQGLDSQIKDRIVKTLDELKHEGAQLKEISLPSVQYALAVYYIINTSEASANLARYDGIRYGYSPNKEKQNGELDLMGQYLQTRGRGFGSEVKRRIMLGTYALSAGYYDAFYLKAQKIRTLLKHDFEQAFKEVDLIAGPVSPFLPFRIGEKTADPLSMYLVDVYTVPVNLVALPAISVPVGKAQNLPIGMQLIAQHFKESVLFRTAKVIERICNPRMVS
ncbi:MAG: Asp-tRNA(Asn)/Glu-tRNA(Gln) amidotransferase subunit GatA [Candidatus Wildermuthbacteria bacterium]|nr:Asp-tRNA(Asn)/Glu-tRNA(Gln) amidotransferase subunit GatA [Candidatus Wildermuthbacteria bacterium]